MVTLTVAYKPPISHEAQKQIAESVTPAMVSPDGDSAQYQTDDAIKAVTIEIDLNILSKIYADYIEF